MRASADTEPTACFNIKIPKSVFSITNLSPCKYLDYERVIYVEQLASKKFNDYVKYIINILVLFLKLS